jgi:alpha-beta hydrolase superfamily lysophospholipase
MAKRLFVIVQGLSGAGRPPNLDPLLERLKADPAVTGDITKWYIYPHRAAALGFRRLISFATDLAAQINQVWITENDLDDVVLLGHSVGGLLVRQAYLAAIERGLTWATKVSRIVLLAAPNRGILPLPIYLQPLHWFIRLFLFWLKLTYQDLMYGSAFITNLRIEWIRCFQARAATTSPRIVQLLGTEDNVVYKYDSRDVLAFPETSYVEVPGATHRDPPVLQTRSTPHGQKELTEESRGRYALLRNAILGTPESLGQIESEPPKPRPANFDRVIFILHGIRASEIDDWVSEVASEIQTQDAQAMVVRPTYGYLSALRFVLPSVRRRNLHWFQDQYTERLAQNPNAEFHFIGHSNGTYMLGQSLQEIPAMKFTRVALAGSVLPVGFFDNNCRILARQQVDAMRSDAGRFDWPVGMLCRTLRHVFLMKDLGTGGYDGFNGGFVEEHRYFEGGHGGMFAQTENIQSIVRFVLTGHSEPSPKISQKDQRFDRLTRMAPYLGLLLIAVMLIGPLLIHEFVATAPNVRYSYLATWYLGEVIAVVILAMVLDVI